MRRKLKNEKKISGLLIFMLLTAILAITATYAWFSTQRDVEVSGMRLNVEVAESLQISLDGEIWTQSIQIANMRQFYGTYTGTGDSFAIYQAKKPDAGGNTNYVPTELLPVSSAGEVANGKLQFVQGTIENNADGTTKLKGITACSENDLTATETVANRQNGNAQHPYLVFDMYLRNISAKTTGLDELLLNAGSAVWVNSGTADDGDQEGAGVAGTGLEYSARVGMVVYGNTISTTATNTQTKTIGQQIRELTAKGDEVAAIWEPNHKEHTAYVVANNGRGITSTSEEVDTYGVKVAVASAATKEIANINATNDANLVAVDTFTPDYTTAEGGVDEKTIITNTAGNNLGIAPNQISKVRIYVWLEGQDPDCIDLASTGDKLNVTLKLTKDQTTTTDKNTYVGDGTGSGNEPTAEIIPEGATYTRYVNGRWEYNDDGAWSEFHFDSAITYNAGDEFPDTVNEFDEYKYGNYEYCYGYSTDDASCHWTIQYNDPVRIDGWSVLCINDVANPGSIMESINGEPLVSMDNAFCMNYNLSIAPKIPNSVTSMKYTFESFDSLTNYEGSTSEDGDFSGYIIPNGVTNMDNTFSECTSIKYAPVIPNNVENMESTFWGCTSLTGTITIHANPTTYRACFYNVDFKTQNITLTGESTMLDEIGATGTNYCAECNGACLENH